MLLGRRRPPRLLPAELHSPNRSLWQMMVNGRPLPAPMSGGCCRLERRKPGFDAIVRVGSHGADEARTRQLTLSLHSALGTAKSPGVRMEFVRESPLRCQ